MKLPNILLIGLMALAACKTPLPAQRFAELSGIRRYDTNGDGRIDRETQVVGEEAWYEKRDTDFDGYYDVLLYCSENPHSEQLVQKIHEAVPVTP
jgi:hypothetical protein